MRTSLSMIVLALVALATGCQSVARPQFFGGGPGPAAQQQMTAQVFDPFPENDIGPPVIGGRPPDYQNPPVEASRARWVQRMFPWLVTDHR